MLAPAQPLSQRRLEQLVVIDRIEHVVDGALGERGRDAGALDLQAHADATAPLHRGFRPRDGVCDARVVDGARLAQADDGRVDRVRVVTLAREALADLSFGELAAREQLQAVDVGSAIAQTG